MTAQTKAQLQAVWTTGQNIEVGTGEADPQNLIDSMLLVSGENAGSTSQAQDFGATGIKADVIAESTTNAGTRIAALLADKLNKNILLVDPGAAGAYTTLSAALAAITAASDSNEYLIVVTGEVAETAAITAKNHVHVLFLPGASITVTSTSTLNAVNFTSLTNTVWAAVDNAKPHIIRAGALGATGSHGLYVVNCGAGVRLVNLNVLNSTSGYGTCHGINNYNGSSPTMYNCTGTGGGGGASCCGILNNTSSRPVMINCTGLHAQSTTSAAITASSRQEDTFQPTASHPWRLLGVSIDVTAAAAGGVTLTLRDATGGGGNALSGAQAVDSTGWKDIPITGHRIISSGNYVYARLSANDATLAYTVYYTYETAYGTCYALYQDSNAVVTIQDCTFISNAASPAIYVTNSGDDRSVFIGGTARSGYNDATRQKAIVCQSSWNPGQVYNMVLAGGSTNLTAAAGTANGSNTEI